MVHLSDAAELRSRIAATLAGGDLDAYVTALVLATGYSDWKSSPWGQPISHLLASPFAESAKPQDVAVLGIRAFFGAPVPTNYPALVERELARRPLPPAATLHDDDRILVGIAAGIGRAALASVVSLGSVSTAASPRSRVLRLWAQRLAAGAGTFDANDRAAAVRLLEDVDTHRSDDAAALLWLGTRLLDGAPMDNAVLETVDARIRDLRKALAAADSDALLPVSIAMLADAYSATPSDRLVRATVLERVFAVIDQFESSAKVLANRHAQRTAFEITDEYDVQDLFHALVLPVIPDCDPEDPAPKVAAKSSRLDFVSKATNLGLEMKYVRNARHADQVREEILLDEATYHAHPSVRKVVAFIYDPQRLIAPATRVQYEHDLSNNITVNGRESLAIPGATRCHSLRREGLGSDLRFSIRRRRHRRPISTGVTIGARGWGQTFVFRFGGRLAPITKVRPSARDRMQPVTRRNVTFTRVVRGPEPAHDPNDSARTSGERMVAVWEVTRAALAWTHASEPRLQRSVVRVQRRRR